MAIAILFTPPSMNADQYDEVIQKLEERGAGSPDGRRWSVCFGEGDNLRVLDVWESQEQFDRFGETLMPLLQEVGLDPGQPEVAPAHNTIAGRSAAPA